MAAVLAAMLGQIGLPGGGLQLCAGLAGALRPAAGTPCRWPRCRRGATACRAFIPVARIADMLLNPGEAFDYNGRRLTYPDIRLVYWAGGNPFHHHQDLGRLRRAFARPETLVVHETAWTATARHADIVLPCTMTLERDDIGGSQTDPLLIAMHRVADPFAEARDDYDIFAALAERLGMGGAFTEGRSSGDWLRHLYGRLQEGAGRRRPSRAGFRHVLAAGRIGTAARSRRWRDPAGFPGGPGRASTAHPQWPDRDLLRHDRRVRLRRLPRPSGLAAAARGARRAAQPAADRQPAGHAAAQPARFRRP